MLAPFSLFKSDHFPQRLQVFFVLQARIRIRRGLVRIKRKEGEKNLITGMTGHSAFSTALKKFEEEHFGNR